MTYFLYYVVVGFDDMSLLNFLSLFLIMGIAADNVLVSKRDKHPQHLASSVFPSLFNFEIQLRNVLQALRFLIPTLKYKSAILCKSPGLLRDLPLLRRGDGAGREARPARAHGLVLLPGWGGYIYIYTHITT